MDADAEVRWLAPYAFTRAAEPRARAMLEQTQRAPDARARLFSARALRKLAVAPDLGLLSDEDLHVRAEAVAAFGAAKAASRLPSAVFADPSAHVRAAVADAFASSGLDSPALLTMARSDSALPRGQALLAAAKVSGEAAAPALAEARKDPSWWIRSKAYEAAGLRPDAEPVLLEGLKDADARVASAALETLAKSTSAAAEQALLAVLRDPKAPLELLGTAVDAAAARSTVPVAALLDAVKAKAPGLTPEVRGSIRKALKPFAEKDKAVADALKRFPEATEKPRRFRPLKQPAIVVLETAKGTVELLLDHRETPNHAAAIADAVKRKVYDGSTWHRVVTAFVVQGGDPRGSGWGDDGWNLADEISRRRFVRGTLGMPKSGKDTGGCQLFVSLVPTPHLDGRYTAFGEVTAGMDVLDRIEPGDAIISARLK
jgi:cyclophilin family peptidyl-prolyl cis-trans isomerase